MVAEVHGVEEKDGEGLSEKVGGFEVAIEVKVKVLDIEEEMLGDAVLDTLADGEIV